MSLFTKKARLKSDWLVSSDGREVQIEEMREDFQDGLKRRRLSKIMMTPPWDSLTTAGRMGVSGSADGHEPTSTLLCACMYLCAAASTGGVDSRRRELARLEALH